MIGKRNIFITFTALLLLSIGLQAQAVTITFGGQAATDGSGKTSTYVNPNNTTNIGSGYFIETFDGDMQGNASITYTANSSGAMGGFSTLDPTELDITGGLGIRQGTVGYAAAPAGDATFYAYGPGPGAGTSTATIKVDYTDFIGYQPNLYISYLGMYYGSIDDYNNIAFYSGDELLQTTSGYLDDGILQGYDILDEFDGNSGNQTDDRSNVYVNLFFEPGEMFTAFEFRTTGIAFEVDNIVSGVSMRPVPEPSTIVLLLSGLIGLAFIVRRRNKV